MTTETDDLSYYEYTLPAVIAGVRRGEKYEHDQKVGEWHQPPPSWQNLNGLIHWLYYGYRVRLAPVPVVRYWSERTDVPINCWIRVKRSQGAWSLVTGIDSNGIYTIAETYHWQEIRELEHSTDLRNWSDCVKPEGGK